MSQSWAALMVTQGCRNVPGVGDMTDTINNQLFALSIEMAQNARRTLEDFIYRPQELTEANRQRVNNLLAVAALPSRNARFRRAVDGIIGRFPQNLSWPPSCTFRATLRGLDALRRISRVTSRSSRRNFFNRRILCDTDEVNFPKNTTNTDGSPIMLNGEPSWQYYCKQTTKSPFFRPCLTLLECDHGLLKSVSIGRPSLQSTTVYTCRFNIVRRRRFWSY